MPHRCADYSKWACQDYIYIFDGRFLEKPWVQLRNRNAIIFQLRQKRNCLDELDCVYLVNLQLNADINPDIDICFQLLLDVRSKPKFAFGHTNILLRLEAHICKKVFKDFLYLLKLGRVNLSEKMKMAELIQKLPDIRPLMREHRRHMSSRNIGTSTNRERSVFRREV